MSDQPNIVELSELAMHFAEAATDHFERTNPTMIIVLSESFTDQERTQMSILASAITAEINEAIENGEQIDADAFKKHAAPKALQICEIFAAVARRVLKDDELSAFINPDDATEENKDAFIKAHAPNLAAIFAPKGP